MKVSFGSIIVDKGTPNTVVIEVDYMHGDADADTTEKHEFPINDPEYMEMLPIFLEYVKKHVGKTPEPGIETGDDTFARWDLEVQDLTVADYYDIHRCAKIERFKLYGYDSSGDKVRVSLGD